MFLQYYQINSGDRSSHAKMNDGCTTLILPINHNETQCVTTLFMQTKHALDTRALTIQCRKN